MTSQQQADEALSVWRANRNHPEVETMLDRVLAPTVTVEHTQVFVALMEEFISFSTKDEYDRILSRVSEEMSCPEITCSPSSSPSQGASL